MRPNKVGQVVRFHTPYPDEDPNMIYHLLDFDERDHFPTPSADIQVIFSDLSFVPINKVRLEELEVVEFDLRDLLGYPVTIVKEDKSEFSGIVTGLCQEKIVPELHVKRGKGVETNVKLTIEDDSGSQHIGMLFVTPELNLGKLRTKGEYPIS
ncbi:hypothetical protein SAMN00777080_1018 [Aquiflexum balticum DSM 16537]|uniref:Uncharacterized protein n=1 Tax=Aquiflexum balticum DSM 16537 TaxID=758820 RepID=A0A1W2H1V3_9BACT|nr:hypothetical protein [Aquiflexum balticum]SMD42466.1 hypothetical protein SAMN00777080_1018 [Aquiflexum balticum DSM 16537]